MPGNCDEQIITAGELGIDPEELWQAADKLRGSIDAAEYKHVVLGLIFLKYISDACEEHHARLEAHELADEEDPDEYRAVSIFWVPPEARWSHLKGAGSAAHGRPARGRRDPPPGSMRCYVVTVYVPDAERWGPDFRGRKETSS
jgi:hypothetical protein